MYRILLCAGASLLCVAVLVGCPSKGRINYQKGLAQFQSQDYQAALTSFDAAQAAEPDSKVVQYFRSRTLYELGRFQEALDGLKKFMTMTEQDKVTYCDDRDTAEFYILKCRQELGIEIEQSPEDIPEERMRY